MRKFLLCLLFLFILGGCAGPLRVAYTPSRPGAPVQEPGLTVRVGPFRDLRPKTERVKPKVIGKIKTTVFRMNTGPLVISKEPAELVREAYDKELSLAGFRVVKEGAADLVLTGVVRQFRLDIGHRDRIEIDIYTKIRDGATGRVLWKGRAYEKGERFAGIFGDTPGTITRYIVASLAKAVRGDVRDMVKRFSRRKPGKKSPESEAPEKAAASGKLLIRTEPERARIHIGGVYYGLTPAEIELPEGVYDLELKKEGYRTFTERVAVGKDRTTEIEESLKESPDGQSAAGTKKGEGE